MKEINLKIEENLKKKKIKMKPKPYFIVLTILYFFLIASATFLALFISSFLFFANYSSGINHLLSFGLKGVLPYISSLPWVPIFSLVALLLIVEIFSKKYDIVSKKPLIYSFLIFLIATVGFGAVLAKTNIHESLYEKAANGRLPIGRGLYENYGTFKSEQLIVAQILEINNKELIVKSQGESYLINLDDVINLPAHQNLFVDQEIIIFGQINKDKIEAIGIRPYKGPKPKYRGKNIQIIELQKITPNSI